MSDKFHIYFFIGRRTYEGLDEEPMVVDDDDEEYDNNQFTGYDNNPKTTQGISKRMKQSPIGKKIIYSTSSCSSLINPAISLTLTNFIG